MPGGLWESPGAVHQKAGERLEIAPANPGTIGEVVPPSAATQIDETGHISLVPSSPSYGLMVAQSSVRWSVGERERAPSQRLRLSSNVSRVSTETLTTLRSFWRNRRPTERVDRGRSDWLGQDMSRVKVILLEAMSQNRTQ
jgi:hypothetical protein